MNGAQKQRMLAGELYRGDDPELEHDRAACRAWLQRYNGSLNTAEDERLVLRELPEELSRVLAANLHSFHA